jgi:hypothetical protein
MAAGPGQMVNARSGLLKAFNHGREGMLADHKELRWGKRKLKRTNEKPPA